MNKKLICFPFVDGNLQEYSYNDLTDEERKKVYDGELIVKNIYGKDEVWRPNEEIELTLHYDGYGRGRSSVTFYWFDDSGFRYPMFIKDMDALIKLGIGNSDIHAIFTYIKRGSNYGIKFLRNIKE